MIFKSMENHAIGSFNLVVEPRVGDRGVVDVDSVILSEVPEDRASESFA
jgi:hypothetical protein